ncbi:acyl-CoA dehydratase activase [Eubacterium oxidoreducens]|uniref:CoA-substrate-specific enzyme activase, putative n=1 Tax=Eubacterium oxidoreducens TaxID=1732 RepID=A0A1G6C8B2_EUBOX|nr:acyl-CoA dehydratase activase [Eubacterium oxidoreducens]SDB29034.1 CoA-substrate-specific enzyme activase, putative [Eubacterium oxidoreducens]
MIGYLCKYAPVEVLSALGATMHQICPNVKSFPHADTLMHANQCSFVKAVVEDFMENDYEGLILTSCCDSTRRLYDALSSNFPDKFIYLLDLPRKVNDFSESLYLDEILAMIEAYGKFTDTSFSISEMEEALHRILSIQETSDCHPAHPTATIGLMGARPHPQIREMIAQQNIRIAFDLTCTGLIRQFPCKGQDVLKSYVHQLLNQMPCMRMINASNRQNYVRGFDGQLDGIVYHTIQFCDLYSYEYAAMKDDLAIPVLSMETDATTLSYGQVRTRMEAFFESISHKPSIQIMSKGTDTMYVLGIDSGSTSTNAVILDEKKQIVASYVTRTGAKATDSALRAVKEVLSLAHLKKEDLSRIISTGYGRVSLPFADDTITEITCHGKGAFFLNPSVRTILDIGGQDSKAIRLNDNGDVIDFVMNDKCAAGTGRFLEMMARSLEIDLASLGRLSLASKENLTISSMCSVFAESEVISLIAQNKETADIARGVVRSIASKSISLIKRINPAPGYMMTGGVAQNEGVVLELKEQLGEEIYLPPSPEIVGALGAAILGLEQ